MGEIKKEKDVKAVFLFYFFELVRWPNVKQENTFNFCLAGNSPVTDSLQEILSTRKERQLQVNFKLLITPQTAAECDLVFIDAQNAEHALQLISTTRGHPILTVSELDGFAQAEGIIELANVENRIVVRINIDALRKNHLSVSSRLLAIADIISED